jgi:hypothetical protein
VLADGIDDQLDVVVTHRQARASAAEVHWVRLLGELRPRIGVDLCGALAAAS